MTFVIFLVFGLFLGATVLEASDNSTALEVAPKERTLSIGPCEWIIDRQCPDKEVKFYLFTRRNKNDRQYVYVDSTSEKSNISESNFDPLHPTKIVIHGYNSDMFLNTLISMKDEYLQKDEYNLLYVDWSTLAPSPCYLSAVHNTKHVGKCVAQLVERLLETGTSNIHLIGFSLGAQLTNYVARNLGSFTLPRITGLDPAMPLFITSGKDDKLDESDAAFVDVIHTNALVQGKLERCGHVDFYMNGGIMQPGCYKSGTNPFACSHQRAPAYFRESIQSLDGFWGWACSSYFSYLLGLCPATNYLVQAGENANHNSRGMYLIVTNEIAPFARGKWTDIDFETKNPSLLRPSTKHSPLLKEVDEWGKLEGDFNNRPQLTTPFAQDPNGGYWPYFGPMGPKEITEEELEEDVGEEEYVYELEARRRLANSKFRRKYSATRGPSRRGEDFNLMKPPTSTFRRRPQPEVFRDNSIYKVPVYREEG